MMENPFAAIPPSSLYIHVPFCASRCSYCDFYSQRPGHDDFDRYTDCLIHEMEASIPADLPFKTLYFGGGTPSFLPLRCWERIFNFIATRLRLDPSAELTLEANPSADLPAKLRPFRDFGINRLSLGLQSSHDRLLQQLGRIHRFDQFEEALQAALRAGFVNISLDLMFGIPGQSMRDFEEDLDYVSALPVTHLSAYSLQIEEGTPLAADVKLDPSILPAEEEEREMYHLLLDRLPGAGFRPYEISNAAKPGYESRHNSVYWRAEPYYALGPSASSYVGGIRRTNVADLKRWMQVWTGRNQAYAASAIDEVVDGESAAHEFAMLSFRRMDGLKREEYAALFHERAEERFADPIERMKERGLILETTEGWRLSRAGLDLANLVFEAFL